MIRAVVMDFGRVFVFPKDEAYFGGLNDLNRVLSESPNYNFLDNFVFNQELLDFMRKEKYQKHFNLYLFTRGKLHQNKECFKFFDQNFKSIFTCEKMNVSKEKPEAYKVICENLGLGPKEILYVDDNPRCTQAAEEAGLSAITFRNNMQFETEFEGYL